MTHQPYKHTDSPKAYLTYPINIDLPKGAGLMAFLYNHTIDKWFKLTIKGETWYEPHCPEFVRKAIIKIGGLVDRIDVPTIEGKRHFDIKDRNGKEKKIEVQIRTKNKSKDKKQFESEIRITGNNPDELLENMKGLKTLLAEWKIEPRECMWSTGAWKDVVVKITRKSDIVKREKALLREQERLQKVVADMQDRITSLEQPLIKKRILQDREVMNGILK